MTDKLPKTDEEWKAQLTPAHHACKGSHACGDSLAFRKRVKICHDQPLPNLLFYRVRNTHRLILRIVWA